MRDAYRYILFAVALVAVLVLAGASLALVTEIFLILFFAILFGVFLTNLSVLIARRTPLGYGVCLAMIIFFLVVVCVGSVALFGVQMEGKLDQAEQNIEEGIDRVHELADRYPSLQRALASTPFIREAFDKKGSDGTSQPANDHAPAESQATSRDQPSSDNQGPEESSEQESDSEEKAGPAAAEVGVITSTAKKGAAVVANIFKTTFGLFVNSLLIFFVGLFLAVNPASYRDGVVKLFPVHRRERTREIMDQMGDTLWHWLIGRFATMLITGAGASLLLILCGTPMAITLGVVTGLLTFIPNIGAFISLVLAVLFSLPQGGTIVLAVVGGYLLLQLLESYLVTPLIQQQQAELPPALLISCQAILGVLLGFLGAAVASPLLAATKVLVEEAYIKDVLEAEELSNGG